MRLSSSFPAAGQNLVLQTRRRVDKTASFHGHPINTTHTFCRTLLSPAESANGLRRAPEGNLTKASNEQASSPRSDPWQRKRHRFGRRKPSKLFAHGCNESRDKPIYQMHISRKSEMRLSGPPPKMDPNTESHHWAWFLGLTCVFEQPAASDQRL